MTGSVIVITTKPANQLARKEFEQWEVEINNNIYTTDTDYIHTIQFSFPVEFSRLATELESFGEKVVTELEPLVSENNLARNLPQIDSYNSIGSRINKIDHHPTYIQAGNIIYGSHLLEKMARAGGLTECLSFLFLSAQTGEAGHNCPIACSAGIIRVLNHIPDFPNKSFYVDRLTDPCFVTNYTGAQFLTEIQGGSDVGLNAVTAKQDEHRHWRISGEKWFCSNAGADLIFVTARYDETISGTKGLGLFLVPAEWEGQVNHYAIRRLKDKIGTRTMATGEIDFNGAYAIQIGKLEEGFHLAMKHVLHLSRIFNAFCVLGMARRAYHIARAYAKHRIAFGNPIYQYPLVQENLAKIKAENTALIAGMYAATKLQDAIDTGQIPDKQARYLIRLLVNMQKYITALWSVEHIHHALDVLAGNGTIEIFSPLPRLLRDCIVCENWEGTHNVLRMQILKDIHKYEVDKLFLFYMHEQLASLAHDEHTSLINKALKKFEDEITVFKNMSTTLQALQIRHIVDKMAYIFNALMLLREAQDQTKLKNTSKMACFEYFILLHLNKNAVSYDEKYMDLVRKII